MKSKPPNKHDPCGYCGHAYFLHIGLNRECEACDDPTIPINKKCPQFSRQKVSIDGKPYEQSTAN